MASRSPEAHPQHLWMRAGSIGNLLHRIPALRSQDSAEQLELDLNRHRKELLESLARIAQRQAEGGIDPSRTTRMAVPHIPELFGTHDKVDLYLSFGEINASFGNDPTPFFSAAAQLADELERHGAFGPAAEHYARVAEAQTKFGGYASINFARADRNLARALKNAEGNLLAEACITTSVEHVARAKLNAGQIDDAMVTIEKVSWFGFRSLLEDTLEPEIEAAKNRQQG